MDLDQLVQSLGRDKPPEGIGGALQALWCEKKGDWDRAHELTQQEPDPEGAWVHAYLHRVEGDESNAGYWYRRAGRPHSQAPLEEEWKEIAQALIGKQ
jgi:hypothetical protein